MNKTIKLLIYKPTEFKENTAIRSIIGRSEDFNLIAFNEPSTKFKYGFCELTLELTWPEEIISEMNWEDKLNKNGFWIIETKKIPTKTRQLLVSKWIGWQQVKFYQPSGEMMRKITIEANKKHPWNKHVWRWL